MLLLKSNSESGIPNETLADDVGLSSWKSCRLTSKLKVIPIPSVDGDEDGAVQEQIKHNFLPGLTEKRKDLRPGSRSQCGNIVVWEPAEDTGDRAASMVGLSGSPAEAVTEHVLWP
jgi:hypothetical protein